MWYELNHGVSQAANDFRSINFNTDFFFFFFFKHMYAMSIFKKVFVEVFFFQMVFFHKIFSTIKFLFYCVWFMLKNRKKFGKCNEYFTTNSLSKKCTIFVAIIVRHLLKLGNYFGILIRIFMTLAIIFMVSEKEQANRLYASKTHSTRPFHRFFFCSHKSTSNSISVWSSCLYCSR